MPYNLILIWRFQKSDLFSHIFSFPSSFLPRLVKNVLKNGSKSYQSNTYRKDLKLLYNVILIWGMPKPNSFSQIFHLTFIFASKLSNSLICFYPFNFYLLIIMTCLYTFFKKTIRFLNVLQRLLFPQLFVLFLQYYNKITKSFLIFMGAIILNCFTFLPV